MKKILTAVCLVAFITPAFADDYREAKNEWRHGWTQTKRDWREAGKVDPKPTKPAKPNEADYPSDDD